MGTPRKRYGSAVNSYENIATLYDGAGNPIDRQTNKIDLFDYRMCQDELNEMALMGLGSYDVGGPLLSVSAKHDFQPALTYAEAPYFGLKWTNEGPLIAYPVYVLGAPTPESAWSYESALDSLMTRVGMGATAISRCRPAQPEASLAVSIAEMLREGVPRTLSQFAKMKDEVARFRDLDNSRKLRVSARSGPSKYLELEFGWKPLVADIRSTSRALLNSHAILEDLRRNSGKRIRRRYTFPADEAPVELLRQDGTRPWPNPNAYVLQQDGPYTITRQDTKKTWFSGEFVYTFPGVNASIPSQMVAGARHLLGVDLTPETIWNVSPWTWLADWYANIGDVVANMTAIGSDDLVLRYGYLMQEAQRTYVHTHSGVRTGGGAAFTVTGKSVFTAKSRIGASPFGFGLSQGDLTPRQIAILTSIGLTRAM